MLPEYVAALETGWSPSTTRDISGEELAAIREDADAFLRTQQEDAGGTIRLGDGSEIPRLPGVTYWISDGAFCGRINLRYQRGTLDLPSYVSGHVGYSVVPWKRRRGIATASLRLLLPLAAARGLTRVLVTCDADNEPSRKVIEAAGGNQAGEREEDEHKKLLFWVPTD